MLVLPYRATVLGMRSGGHMDTQRVQRRNAATYYAAANAHYSFDAVSCLFIPFGLYRRLHRAMRQDPTSKL